MGDVCKGGSADAIMIDNSSAEIEKGREEKEERQPNLEGAIENWIGALQEYPDMAQAAAVWDRLKETDSEDLLFAVDGAAEALANRCVSFQYVICAEGLLSMMRAAVIGNIVTAAQNSTLPMVCGPCTEISLAPILSSPVEFITESGRSANKYINVTYSRSKLTE